MNVAILAAPRPAPNVHSTLASMCLAGGDSFPLRISVIWDGSDVSEFAAYRHLKDVSILSCTLDEMRERACLERRIRPAAQYAKCLRQTTSTGVLVCEDDITFAPDWSDKVQVEIERQPEDNFILLCYNREAPGTREHPMGIPLWASTCIWYPKHIALELADSFSQCNISHDEWIGQFCAARGIPIRIRPIVQHVGDYSLLNPSHGKRFSEEWEQLYGGKK